MADPWYSLYCKQSELQRSWHQHWACGFASLITCFRLLGDRTTEDREIIRKFREFGGRPHNGMLTDEAVELACAFGYKPARNPSSTRRDGVDFLNWMKLHWAKGHPIMVSVDSENSEQEADHWWVVFGAPGDSNAWVMDPMEDQHPFEYLSYADILEFAACDDGEGYLEYDALAISAPASAKMTPVPASVALMDFLNENLVHETGWTSQQVAAALVDNHFSSLDDLASRGHARGVGFVAVSGLLDDGGAVEGVIDDWDTFFSEKQRKNIKALQVVLHDVEFCIAHNVAAAEVDHMTREIALNLILIGTNLLDG